MKTNNFILILLLISFISCRNNIQDSTVVTFEEALGEPFTEILNNSINTFDAVLAETFPSNSIHDTYEKFLLKCSDTDCSLKEFGSNSSIIRQILKDFSTSGFESEIIMRTSSVEYIDSSIHTKYLYFDKITGDTIGSVTSESFPDASIMNIDSLMREEETIIIFNPFGKYIQALSSVQDCDPIIQDYVDFKKGIGLTVFKFFCKGFLDSEPDYSDYIIKRIILIELLY